MSDPWAFKGSQGLPKGVKKSFFQIFVSSLSSDPPTKQKQIIFKLVPGSDRGTPKVAHDRSLWGPCVPHEDQRGAPWEEHRGALVVLKGLWAVPYKALKGLMGPLRAISRYRSSCRPLDKQV